MFAILLTDKMDVFYHNILSFPTLIFTLLLLFCMLFWLIAILGMIDISILDPNIDLGDIGDGADVEHAPSAVSSIIHRLGLNGVPLTLIITFIALFGWLFSFYGVFFLEGILPGGPIWWLASVVIFVASLVAATYLTSFVIKPLRRFFKGLEQQVEKHVVGQTAVVRTSKVDQSMGEGTVDDGGAGLILPLRPAGSDTFVRGDHVVIIDYNAEKNIFLVVSETEFGR